MTDSTIRHTDPENVVVDEMNERTSDPQVDELVDSVERLGVVQPPMVRANEDETYTVVIGQRRVRAAQHAESVDEIPVVVMDWSDHDALTASITENIGLFRNKVPPTDRAQALQRLWEEMGGSGVPVNSHLAGELGVPRTTIRTWLEPLHDDWEGTSIDPTSPTETSETPDTTDTTDDTTDDTTESDTATDTPTRSPADELGERALAEVRRMTGGGEDGEAVARVAAEKELTQPEIQDAKTLVDEADADPYEAIQEMADDEPNPVSGDDNRHETTTIEANVTFDTEVSAAMKSYTDETGQDAAAVVNDAVQWFLESEGALPADQDAVEGGSTDETPGQATDNPPSHDLLSNDDDDDSDRPTPTPASEL
jgi:ParB/RepB/Spo0J family partition protein